MRPIRLTLAVLALSGLCVAAHAAPAPPPLEAYGRLPALSDVALSPDGQRIALIAAVGDKRYVVIKPLSGPIIKSIETNDRKVRSVEWADNEHVFITFTEAVDLGGEEEFKVEDAATIMINLKTGQGVTLHEFANALIAGAPSLTVHEGGHTFGYYGLARLDLDTGSIARADRTSEHTVDLVRKPDGTAAAREESYDHGRTWKILPGASDGAVLLQGSADGGESGGMLGFGRTYDTVLVERPGDGNLNNLRELSLTTGKLSAPLVENAGAVPIHDAKTRLLIGFTVGGVGDLYFFDPKLQEIWKSIEAGFPDLALTVMSRSDDMQRWVVRTEGQKDSGHYYLIDIAQKKAIPLGGEYPDVKAGQVGEFRYFEYTAADGTKLQGVLTLPPGREAKNLPLVMLPHGGPREHDVTHFDWWAQALASRGYAVFQPNFRGSTGYGEDFIHAGYGQWGRKMQTDVSDAIPALAAEGLIDPKRVCITGASYGGYVAAAGVTLQSGIYRCAAADAGVYDLNTFVWWVANREGKDGPAAGYWRLATGMKANDDPAGAQISPTREAARANAPIMLTHGRQDTVVPFDQSEGFVAALRAANKPVELVVMQNEDHWLSRGATRTEMLTATVNFIMKYNPPDPAPVTATTMDAKPTAGR